GGDVAVDAVEADVERPADEPLREGQVPLEDRVPLPGPVEKLRCLSGPEAFEVAFRFVVDLGVDDAGRLLERGRRGERAPLGEQGLDGGFRHRSPFVAGCPGQAICDTSHSTPPGNPDRGVSLPPVSLSVQATQHTDRPTQEEPSWARPWCGSRSPGATSTPFRSSTPSSFTGRSTPTTPPATAWSTPPATAASRAG